MEKRQHVTLIAIIHIAFGAIFLFVGVIGFVLLSGLGFFSCDETAFGILGLLGTIALIFFSVLSIPGIICGIGLLKYRNWARILGIVLGAIDLFNVPIGTAFGLYSIWILIDPETIRLFEPTPVVPATPTA